MRAFSLIALLVTIPLAGPALAADLSVPAPAPVYKAAPPPPVMGWSGIYVGGSLGARWSQTDGQVTSVQVGDPAGTPLDLTIGPSNAFDSLAFRAGGYFGANWQTSQQTVVGFEVDGGWVDNKKSRTGSFFPSDVAFNTPSIAQAGGFPLGGSDHDSFQVRNTWDASLRLRAGVLATPAILLYATGGVAWIHMEGKSNCSTVPLPGLVSNCATGNNFGGTLSPSVLTDTATRIGWTIGAGIEGMFSSNWIWRAEYRYADFGTQHFTETRRCPDCSAPNEADPLVVTYSLRTITHTYSVGLGYKF